MGSSAHQYSRMCCAVQLSILLSTTVFGIDMDRIGSDSQIDADWHTFEGACTSAGSTFPNGRQLRKVQANQEDVHGSGGFLAHLARDVEEKALSMYPWKRSPYAFQARHQCKTEPTIDAAFAALDARMQRKINREDVEREFQNERVGLRFTIRQGLLNYQVHPGKKEEALWRRVGGYETLIRDLLDEVELPDMEFAMSVLDGSPKEGVALKAEGTPGEEILMIPRSLLDWGQTPRSLAEESSAKPCASRKPQAVFRGATTGGRHSWNESDSDHALRAPDGRSLPRYEVVGLSVSRPELLDAGFTSVVQADKPDRWAASLRERGMLRGNMSDAEQRCFAAVVVVDGNSVPDRLPRQLAYGVPVVLLHERSGEFWYPELRPGIDFVPATPHSLADVLERLQARPDLARCIGENGRRFVTQKLSESRLKCYFYQVLSQYAKRYQKTVLG